MKRGISTNRNTAGSAQCLKSAGVDFVFRYYSQTTRQPEKRLTPAEAEALSAVGLRIGVVYEDAPEVVTYFSGLRGHQDGVNAYHAALALHQPAGSAIYFAVDYDATLADITGPVFDYFQGVKRGMGDAGGGTSSYGIGIYGSGAACAFIKSHCAFVTYAWLAESRGWQGSKTYDGWDVSQAVSTGPLCELAQNEYDDDFAREDFGGFVLGYVPSPSGPSPSGQVGA